MTDNALKPLLILSIFAPSEHNQLWYDLQQRFIRKTTSVEYDYGLFLNGVSPEDYTPDHILQHSSTNKGHKEGMDHILNYARHHPYQNYLILDSDCFPIRNNWFAELKDQMKRFNKTVAAPIRAENLDLFPHPCAVFITQEEIHNERIDFKNDIVIKNMAGFEAADVGTAMYGMEQVLPMLRTNVINVHPLAAAIYNYMFYHHGAGSRAFDFRIEQINYYDHLSLTETKHQLAGRLMNDLQKNPEKFLNMLMGNFSSPIQKIMSKYLGLY